MPLSPPRPLRFAAAEQAALRATAAIAPAAPTAPDAAATTLFDGADKFPRMPERLVPSVHRAWQNANRSTWEQYTRCVRTIRSDSTAAALDSLTLARHALGTISVYPSKQRTALTRYAATGEPTERRLNYSTVRHPTSSATAATTSDEHTIRRMVKHVSSGTSHAIRRASRAAFQPKLAPPNDETVAKLSALHPDRSAVFPSHDIRAVPPVATADDISEALRRGVARDTAPGPLGWTGELIAPLMADADCAAGVTTLINELIGGRLSPQAIAAVTATRLIAATKPGGDIRPIGMGDAFYKIAGEIVCRRLAPSLHEVFPRIQLGIGVPGGVQIAFHLLQRALEAHPNAVAIKFDVRNAFNTRRRDLIADSIRDTPKLHPMWPLFRSVYGRSGTALVYGAERRLTGCVSVREGVIQGDRIASLAYAASMQPLYERLYDQTDGLHEMTAIHDDLNAVGTVEGICALIANVAREYEAQKITLNWQKCSALWAHPSDPPAELITLCGKFGIRLERTSLSTLGGLLGLDRSRIATKLHAQVQGDYAEYLRLINHPQMPVQVARFLATQSAQPALSYLTRIHRPGDMREAVEWFDTKLWQQTLIKLVGARELAAIPLAARTQASLSIRHAGLALRPHDRTADAAFYAAAAQAMPHVKVTPTNTLPYDDAIAAAAVRITALVGDRRKLRSIILTDTKAMHERFHKVNEKDDAAKELQRKITHAIEERLAAELFDSASPSDKARLTALHAPHAMLVERICRQSFLRQTYLTDREAVQRNRLVLGMNAVDHEETCKCGRALTSNHASACKETRKLCTEPRHDMVRDAIKSSLNEFNVSSQIEYAPLSHAIVDGCKPKRVRPDGVTPVLGEMWDVAVTTPTCESYVDRKSDTEKLVAAGIIERFKRSKYTAVAQAEGLKFTPLVFEAFGGFGMGAREFLCRAADYAVEVSGGGEYDRGFILEHLRCCIAFAIAKGHAKLVANAMLLAAKHRAVPVTFTRTLHGSAATLVVPCGVAVTSRVTRR